MISKNFSRNEIECKCGCGYDRPVDAELIAVLEDVRGHFNSAVVVYSCLRCEAHNKEAGGAKASQHLKGTAADIVVRGVDIIDVQEYLLSKYAGKYGIGIYATFAHIDVRNSATRWYS